MTPAMQIRSIINSDMETAGYEVFVNHLPDKPDKAVVIVDTPFGRLEDRSMSTGEVDEHPTVQITVRGRTDQETADTLRSIWTILKAVYMLPVSGGETVQSITKTTTMSSLGQEIQNRRVRYTQQFRMTILSE